MDADGENIQITRAESTDIDEISLLSAKTSEYNAITRTMLTTKPRDFDLAARETFYRFWYTRALGDSKSSNVVFKATDAQGKVIGCFWLQWFHGHLRSWTVTGSTRLPFLKPLLSTLPACIRKEAYYELLVMIHQHRMDWMETTSHIPGQGYWCTYKLPGLQQVSGASADPSLIIRPEDIGILASIRKRRRSCQAAYKSRIRL